MCCFSQPVELVSNTNIFARSANGRQYLVYSMSYAAAAELAMVLPLPVPPNSAEDAVKFINLERYPEFFADMLGGFPFQTGSWATEAVRAVPPKLLVHDVGEFEASFVPRIDEFRRLDERFRIPPDVWDRLPAYHDYGFAVFKLKASRSPWLASARRLLFGSTPAEGSRNPRSVHPMAFTFPRRVPELLYFPTVHVHDRDVHSDAAFDHTLYCQPDAAMDDYLEDWEQSDKRASQFIDVRRAEGIVDPDQCCWRLGLGGLRQNKDTLVGRGGAHPELSAANYA
jgi:hypothetical protein